MLNRNGLISFPLFILMATQLITGGTYLVAKLGLMEFDPISLGCLRFGLAALAFIPILAVTHELKMPPKSDWGLFLLIAFLAVPLNQGLFLCGIKLTFAGHGALLYATTPMIVLVLSVMIGREHPSIKKFCGILLGFLGVILVLLDKQVAFSQNTYLGDFLIFMGVVVWGIYTLLIKNMVTRYSPIYLTGISLILGAILFLPIAIPFLASMDLAKITWRGIGALLYLSLLTSVFAYFIWSWGLKQFDASKTAIVSNLQPIVAALLGWFVLGEPISITFVIGAIAVFIGILFTHRG